MPDIVVHQIVTDRAGAQGAAAATRELVRQPNVRVIITVRWSDGLADNSPRRAPSMTPALALGSF